MKKIKILIEYDDESGNVTTTGYHLEGAEKMDILNEKHRDLILDIFETAIEAFTENVNLKKEIENITRCTK